MAGNISDIGENSVYLYLAIENVILRNGHRIIAIPGSNEYFRKNDARIPILQKLYPDCVAMGARENSKSPMDGFAKIIQRYGCDILETWNDEEGKQIVVWHEVKTDQRGLDTVPLENNGSVFWKVAEEYISVQEKKGYGNMIVEFDQYNGKRGSGWYPKYRDFTLKHDTLDNVPGKPFAHYLWYCFMVIDAGNDKRILAIKTTMENLIAKTEANNNKYKLPLRNIWWVNDKCKNMISDLELKPILDNSLKAKQMIMFLDAVGFNRERGVYNGIRSDTGDAELHYIPVPNDIELHAVLDLNDIELHAVRE